MANLYENVWKKNEILKYIGDPLQIAGAIPATLNNGKANGVNSVHVRTGSGLDFIVLPGRGMDIPLATYKGIFLTYFSGTGITSPSYYEEPAFKWLRSFNVGLLTTCGITYSGMPCDDAGESLGLHGRIANTEAENVSIVQEWVGDDFIIKVKGKMREASAMFEYVSCTREIETKMGSNKIVIRDVVENHGFKPQPLMMLYHINFGYPLLSPNSELVVPALNSKARDRHSADGIENCMTFEKPINEDKERAYFHVPATEDNGMTAVGIVNKNIGDGSPMAVSVKYNTNQLPKLFEWKITREGFYACGIEPGTSHPIGRDKVREDGQLLMLGQQERYSIDLEFEVLDTNEDIDVFQKYVKDLLARSKENQGSKE